MSLVKIQGNASGTGTLTIAAPNTSSNYTLTLPTQTGNILTSATTTGFPAGSVLQVVQTESTTSTAISSTSYTDGTNLNATITPTSATSKILIVCSSAIYVQRGTNNDVIGSVNILRSSTSIAEYIGAIQISAATNVNGYITNTSQGCFQYLDSPSTTSSITYKLQGKVSTTSNGASFYFNPAGARTVITLMEIAA